MRELGVSGTYDAAPSPEDAEPENGEAGEDVADEPERTERKSQYEAAADGAFLEVSDRVAACGGEETYPFEASDNYLAVREQTERSVYVFLLLLSAFGHDAGPTPGDGAKLFEELAAQAAQTYLGGQMGLARSKVFGFPRRLLPKDFGSALDDLCRTLGEGLGHRERPTSNDQKDAKLDVVAWREFPDSRRGKLIAFGQCATGANWAEKLTELQPPEWCRFWMRETPATLPVRFFFVPHRIAEKDWFQTCVHGGVLFERCRIAHLVRELPSELTGRLTAWSGFVLDRALRAQVQLANAQ